LCQFFFIWQQIGNLKRNGSEFLAQIAMKILFWGDFDFAQSPQKDCNEKLDCAWM